MANGKHSGLAHVVNSGLGMHAWLTVCTRGKQYARVENGMHIWLTVCTRGKWYAHVANGMHRGLNARQQMVCTHGKRYAHVANGMHTW